MQVQAQQIIDEGIIKATDGLTYRYRCFLDMPIGMGILYPVDKKPETLMQEMDIEREKQETVLWTNTGQILPVHKNEDGSVEVPLVLLSVYLALFSNDFELIFVFDDFEKDHKNLYDIWSRNWKEYKSSSM